MTEYPSIETERLVLNRFEKDDAFLLSKYISEPTIRDMLRKLPNSYGIDEAEKWINEHGELFLNRKAIIFAIRLKEEKALTGSIGLHTFFQQHSCEIGYWIAKPYHNKGFATEALKHTVRFAIEELRIVRVFSRCFARNKNSISVLQKAGYTYEGCMRKGYFKSGKFEDINVYSILSEEF